MPRRTSPEQASAPGGRRAALFCALNAAALTSLLLWRARAMLAAADPGFTAGDRWLFACYSAAVIGALALLLLGGQRLGARVLAGGGLARESAERVAGAGLVLATLLLDLVVLIDVKTYALLGVHLYSAFVLDNVLHPASSNGDLHLGGASLAPAALAAALTAAALASLAWLLRWVERRHPRTSQRWATALLRLGLALWAAAALGAGGALAGSEVRDRPATASLLLWQPARSLRQLQRTLGAEFTYRTPPAERLPRLRRPVSILTVVVETFRADAFGPELTPALEEFARRHACLRPERNWAASHSTAYSVFSVLSGLHPSYADPVGERQRALFPLELLARNGYAIVGASASRLATYPQLAGILRAVPGYTEFLDGPDRDRPLLSWFERAHERLDPRRPYAAFLFLYTPHHNYYYPPQFERHTPVLPLDYDHFSGDEKLGRHREEIHNRYRNSVLYLDSLLARVFERVRPELEAGTLAVVVTGDHGEEFWEHGLLGHGQARLVNERVQTPLLICLPGVATEAPAVSSHVDIWPTLLDYLSPDPPLDPSAYFSGVSLLSPPPRERYALVSGHGFPYRSDTAALVTARGKLLLRKETAAVDAENAFQVVGVTDLDDRPDAALREALEPALAALRSDMNRFFAFAPAKGGAAARPPPRQ